MSNEAAGWILVAMFSGITIFYLCLIAWLTKDAWRSRKGRNGRNP